MIDKNKITVSGKRKTAIAKATISKGEGIILINKIPIDNLDLFKKLMIEEPVEITKKVLGNFKFDISVNVRGGGTESRIEASRLAIARALVEFSKNQELKKMFLDYDKNLMVADTRRKEPNKPGDSKARSKRQKSFR